LKSTLAPTALWNGPFTPTAVLLLLLLLVLLLLLLLNAAGPASGITCILLA
jgi:hypothetical protein